MVRCNLSVLLAERNLKITKVCKDTGISRTTLTYLANNYSKGIQYDTLNTLCSYLNVSPGELISFIPANISVNYVHRNGTNIEIELMISQNGKTITSGLSGFLQFDFQDPDDPYFSQRINLHKPCGVYIYVEPWDDEANPLFKDEIEFTIKVFQSLPISFLKDIENDITSEIVNDLDYEYHLDTLPKPILTSFQWAPILQKPPTTE